MDEKPHRSRSKSAETVLRNRLGTLRYTILSQSVTSLDEFVEYAEKKAKRTMTKVVPQLNQNTLLEEEFINGNTLFSGVSNGSEADKFDVVASMMECGFTDDAVIGQDTKEIYIGIIKEQHNKCTLRRVQGRSKKFEPKFDEDGVLLKGELITPILDEYYKFLTYRDAVVRKTDRVNTNEFKTYENDDFRPLCVCYDRIFKFNRYLLIHLLDLLSARLFNPYTIYQSELEKDVEFLQNNIEAAKKRMNSVVDQLFNKWPLRRQLEDLHAIRDRFSDEEMKRHVASLARYAIERIRVPQSAEGLLGYYTWVNATPEHLDTYDVINWSPDDFIPLQFDEIEFLRKTKESAFNVNTVRKHANGFLAKPRSMTRNILNGFFNRNQEFYNNVRRMLPNKSIDPVMMSLFQYQVLEKISSVLICKNRILTTSDLDALGDVAGTVMIAGLAENPKRATLSDYWAEVLEDVYADLCRIEVRPLPVYPSTIGISFICFKDRLFFSVVQERKVVTRNEYVVDSFLDLDNGFVKKVEMNGVKMNIFVDKNDSSVSVNWVHQEGSVKNERFRIAGLDRELMNGSEVDIVKAVYASHLQGGLNQLRKYLDELPPTEYNPNRLGRLEHPTAFPMRETERSSPGPSNQMRSIDNSYMTMDGSDTDNETADTDGSYSDDNDGSI